MEISVADVIHKKLYEGEDRKENLDCVQRSERMKTLQ